MSKNSRIALTLLNILVWSLFNHLEWAFVSVLWGLILARDLYMWYCIFKTIHVCNKSMRRFPNNKEHCKTMQGYKDQLFKTENITEQ